MRLGVDIYRDAEFIFLAANVEERLAATRAHARRMMALVGLARVPIRRVSAFHHPAATGRTVAFTDRWQRPALDCIVTRAGLASRRAPEGSRCPASFDNGTYWSIWAPSGGCRGPRLTTAGCSQVIWPHLSS